MKLKQFLLGLIFILLGLVIIIGIILFTTYLGRETSLKDSENTYLDQDNNSNSNQKIEFESSNYQSEIESIYNENITANKSKQVQINELYLTLDVLSAMKGKGWNGDKDTPLPISGNDLSVSKLSNYVENERSKEGLLTIPSEMEDLFIRKESAKEIEQIILSSYNEYLDYLTSRGTLEKYITEFKNVLPANLERITYFPVNDPSSPPTATESLRKEDGEKDYSKLVMSVYAVDIYNYFTNVIDSEILGSEPTNENAKQDYLIANRNIALRQLMYHEFTHVLQQTYVNIYSSAEDLGKKSGWAEADKRLMDVDDQYFWKWGNREAFQLSNNRQIANESQAEGISFEVLTEVYNMSSQQKAALWEFAFGRLSNMQSVLEKVKDEFQTSYPNFSPDEFGNLMADIFSDYSGPNGYELKRISFKIAALPIYIGYINPMLPEDTIKIWDALNQ